LPYCSVPVIIAVMDLRALATEYVKTFGIADDLPYIHIPFEWEGPMNQQRSLAEWYDKIEDDSSSWIVKSFYSQLALEVSAQFGFLVAKGFTFTKSYLAATYVTSGELHDAARAGEVRVYDFEHNHPILTPTQNFMLRAVHDVFAHAMPRASFGPRGEFIGYLNHRLMFSPTAALAYATETHAQNSWFNYGPFSHLPAIERPFAPQKAVIIPQEFRIPETIGLKK
jgi:hypothetical protein